MNYNEREDFQRGGTSKPLTGDDLRRHIDEQTRSSRLMMKVKSYEEYAILASVEGLPPFSRDMFDFTRELFAGKIRL